MGCLLKLGVSSSQQHHRVSGLPQFAYRRNVDKYCKHLCESIYTPSLWNKALLAFYCRLSWPLTVYISCTAPGLPDNDPCECSEHFVQRLIDFQKITTDLLSAISVEATEKFSYLWLFGPQFAHNENLCYWHGILISFERTTGLASIGFYT